jgi:hypothetical protein
MFIGAAGGIALSHLPGLPMVAGVAMGIGAMSAVMLKLPLTSVLLATLLLGSDGLAVMPLAIVAVVVAHVASAWIAAPPEPDEQVKAAPARARRGRAAGRSLVKREHRTACAAVLQTRVCCANGARPAGDGLRDLRAGHQRVEALLRPAWLRRAIKRQGRDLGVVCPA